MKHIINRDFFSIFCIKLKYLIHYKIGEKMKTIFYIGLVISVYFLMGTITSYAIPNENIRIRIIANSDSEYDQQIKNEVKEEIQKDFYNLLKDTKGVEEARKVINNNLTSIDNKVFNILESNNYPTNYKINYGLNYFPSKEYKGTVYEEGYYESLVITLGEGKGSNWWCVLFPPLCLLEAEENDTVEYTSFVKELFQKYL